MGPSEFRPRVSCYQYYVGLMQLPVLYLSVVIFRR